MSRLLLQEYPESSLQISVDAKWDAFAFEWDAKKLGTSGSL